MVQVEPVDQVALSEQLEAFVAAVGQGELEEQHLQVCAFLQSVLPRISELGDDLRRDLARFVYFWHDYLGGLPRGLEAAAQQVASDVAAAMPGQGVANAAWDIDELHEFAEHLSSSTAIRSGELLGTTPSTDKEWRRFWKELKEHGGLE